MPPDSAPSASASGTLTLTLLDGIGKLPGSGRELSECLSDGDHAHARPRAAELLDRIVKALPSGCWRKRRTPGRWAKLLRRRPGWSRAPAEAFLLGVAVSRLLLGGGVGQRAQSAGETCVGRRLGMVADGAVPTTFGELKLLAGALNAHPAPPDAC